MAHTLKTPFLVVQTRLGLYKEQQSRKNSSSLLLKVVRDIASTEGMGAFFKGLGPTILLSSHGVIHMYIYENLNHVLGFHSG